VKLLETVTDFISIFQIPNLTPDDKIRQFAQSVGGKSLIEKRQIAEELAKEKLRLEQRIKLIEIQADIMYFFVTSQSLEEQWDGIEWIQIQLKQMDFEQTTSLRSSLAMSYSAGGGGAWPSAGPSVASASARTFSGPTSVGESDGSTSVGESARESVGGFKDFNDDELANVDLSYYRT
jgi:hypothetical protein